jgi:Methyltransferase domain
VINSIKKLVLHKIETIFFGGRKGLDNADEALRYLPISDLILASDLKAPKILEVGSGVKGITPYIPYMITGVDVSFNGDVAENLRPVCLSGAKLPFPDGSYDFVISVDMLEHVNVNERSEVITELLRVASRRVFLSVPCGKLAEAHDMALDEFYQHVNGVRYHFFQDHIENGLPEKDELASRIKFSADALGLKIELQVISNVNLKVRNFFMRLWIISKSAKLYTWISPFLCLFRRLLNSGECYRQLFLVDILQQEKL